MMKQDEVHAHSTIDTRGIAVVHVTGLVITNLGTTTVNEEIEQLIVDMDTPKIILNLSDVSYLDSFSFGWIMGVYRAIRAKGGEFALCSPNEDIRYLFEITDFTRVVPAYRTEQEAREAIVTGNQSKRIVYI